MLTWMSVIREIHPESHTFNAEGLVANASIELRPMLEGHYTSAILPDQP